MIAGPRKSYSFKSVGQLQEEVAEQTALVKNSKPLIGIKTPIQFTDSGGIFQMHTNLLKTIKDNFKNLLLTNHGERVGLYDFGADLLPLTFDLGTEEFDAKAIKNISTAVKKYMPFIEPSTFEPFTDNFDNRKVAKVGFRITYTVPLITAKEQQIDVILYVGG